MLTTAAFGQNNNDSGSTIVRGGGIGSITCPDGSSNKAVIAFVVSGNVVSLQKRIDNVRMKVGQRRTGRGEVHNSNKPKVLCIEWIDPFFTAGHWIPQMVEIAGGVNALNSRAQPSRRMHDINEIMKFNPDKIITIISI